MPKNMNSQNYVVLGASGGVGSEVARRLRRDGHRVLLASRSSDHLEKLGAELDAPTCELDARDVDQVDNSFITAVEMFGEIEGAVNCVGSLLLKPAHLTTESEWSDTIATNLTSAFATVRAAAKTMARSGGSVVLMSSAAGRIGLASHEAIAAAKAGIVGLTQSAAASYAGKRLRFNSVAPGLVKSKLTKRIWENERTEANSVALHALGRLANPTEIASLITWLLHPENSWVTGEVFSIDGGLSNVRLNPQPAAQA